MTWSWLQEGDGRLYEGYSGSLPTEADLIKHLKTAKYISVSELGYAFKVSPQKAKGLLQGLAKRGVLATSGDVRRGLRYSLSVEP